MIAVQPERITNFRSWAKLSTSGQGRALWECCKLRSERKMWERAKQRIRVNVENKRKKDMCKDSNMWKTLTGLRQSKEAGSIETEHHNEKDQLRGRLHGDGFSEPWEGMVIYA